jgi:hypothetical protein
VWSHNNFGSQLNLAFSTGSHWASDCLRTSLPSEQAAGHKPLITGTVTLLSELKLVASFKYSGCEVVVKFFICVIIRENKFIETCVSLSETKPI